MCTNLLRILPYGGLYLSTYGYWDTAFEALTEIEKHTLRFGNERKIYALCQTYMKAREGLWTIPDSLSDLFYEDTIQP